MKIVFFGSSHFAQDQLKALIEAGHNIACVVTQPDKKKGRHLVLSSTAVKDLAQSFGLKVFQPEKINRPECVKLLQQLEPEIFVVVAYGQILSEVLLSIPAKLALNIHASLLPKYRGAAPINWAIIRGEKSSGITIFKLNKKMDAGPIIAQKAVPIIPEDTALTLEEKLSRLSLALLPEALKMIENNAFTLNPQDESQVSFAPKLKKEDGLIDWAKPAEEINNLVKGCINWPGAFTYYNGKVLKVFKSAVITQAQAVSSEITEISKKGLAVATGKGILLIQELQLEGKRRMMAEEFIAGHKIGLGVRLGKK